MSCVIGVTLINTVSSLINICQRQSKYSCRALIGINAFLSCLNIHATCTRFAWKLMSQPSCQETKSISCVRMGHSENADFTLISAKCSCISHRDCIRDTRALAHQPPMMTSNSINEKVMQTPSNCLVRRHTANAAKRFACQIKGWIAFLSG